MYCVRLCGIVWFCDCVLRMPCLCVWYAVLCDDVSVCVFLLLYWVLKASTDGLCASVRVWADHLWCQCLCASQGYFSFYLCFVFSSCFVLYQCGDACVCVCVLFCVHCVGLCARPINTHYQTHKYNNNFRIGCYSFLEIKMSTPHDQSLTAQWPHWRIKILDFTNPFAYRVLEFLDFTYLFANGSKIFRKDQLADWIRYHFPAVSVGGKT